MTLGDEANLAWDRPCRADDLVSVTIPTYNEEEALPVALQALRSQTCRNIEVIVVDSNSSDKTRKIAADFGAKVLCYDGRLLGARHLGLVESKGHLVLFLDADQILKPSAISRGVRMMDDFDMLVLAEDSYMPTTIVQKLLARERASVHKIDTALDPLTGGLLPRLFRRDLALKIFERIPSRLLATVVAHDHAIMYYEARKISNRVGILQNAVSHIEPSSLLELLLHFYRFGQSSRAFANAGDYTEILVRKGVRTRNVRVAIQDGTLMLAALRSASYQLGFLLGGSDSNLRSH